MANIIETPQWVGVYLLELGDLVEGGAPIYDGNGDPVQGFSNAPLKNLVDRTAYLKQVLDQYATSKENTVAAGTTSQYYRGDKQWATLDKTAVGLSNVDNTSDDNKPISNATQLALNDKVDVISKGVPLGVATLDINGYVPLTQVNPVVNIDVDFQGITKVSTADINGGTIDNTTIGATAPSSGIFTSLTSTTVDINGGNIDGTAIGATSPSTGKFTNLEASGTVEFTSTGAMRIPSGQTADRPDGEEAFLRFNKTSAEFEGHNGVEWSSVGGSKIEQDSTTASSLYPVFVDSTSGTAKVVNVDDTKLTYNPAKGELKSDYLISESGIVMMKRVITKDTVIPSGYTAVVTEMEVGLGVSFEVAPGGFVTNV